MSTPFAEVIGREANRFFNISPNRVLWTWWIASPVALLHLLQRNGQRSVASTSWCSRPLSLLLSLFFSTRLPDIAHQCGRVASFIVAVKVTRSLRSAPSA